MALQRPEDKTDLANLGLGLIGESRIADIDGDNAVEIDAATVMDQVIFEVEADYPWPELTVVDAELTLDDAYAPGDQDAYLYRFDLPDDFVQLAKGPGKEKLVLKDSTGGFVDYDLMGGYIYATADEVYLTYIAESEDPSGWSPWLTKAVYTLFAIYMAPMRNKSKTLTESLVNIYEKLVRPRTRSRASRNRTTHRERNTSGRKNSYDRAGRGV